jgi:hypothetical protein
MAWCLVEQPAATAWSLEAGPDAAVWTEERGDTFWPTDDELWTPWTDGSWFLDHDGAFVGWTDWPPPWGQTPPAEPCSCLADGAYLTDDAGNPLTDESGLILLYD